MAKVVYDRESHEIRWENTDTGEVEHRVSTSSVVNQSAEHIKGIARDLSGKHDDVDYDSFDDRPWWKFW